MSSSSSPPLEIELRRSRRLAGYLLALHAAALAAPWLARLPALVSLLWGLVVLELLRREWRAHWRTAPYRLRLGSGGGVAWMGCAGAGSGQLVDGFAQPWLCLLRIDAGGRRRTLVVPADACRAEDHRRLRARLRQWAQEQGKVRREERVPWHRRILRRRP